MKRRTLYTVSGLLCVIIFFGSVGTTLANWAVRNDTVNKLTLGKVEGEIVERYVQGQTVNPGAEVEKIVNVKNTGNVDSLVRVRLSKAWGETRNTDGTLNVNDTLDPSSIHITCNDEKWYFNPNDGYYYYLGVLAPDELTAEPLFEGFEVDSSIGNDYSNMQADIKIDMECVQAGGNGVSAWGTSLEALGIEYNPSTPVLPDIEVDFKGPDEGFKFNAYEGDLFVNFKNLIPGDYRSEILRVDNSYEKGAEIFLRAEITEQTHATPETLKYIDRLLKEYAIIKITALDGTLIYNGPVWGALGEADNSGTMKSNLSLGKFASGSYRSFTVELTLSPDMGNEYSELLGMVKWVFEAEGISSDYTPENPEIPDTGVYAQFVPCFALMIASGILATVLFKKRKTASDEA
ncbi:MAG: hypothetical protein GX051_03925 [Clostridiales bacterium]|nr:hypothetical protein [Clostridiales bacterium]